MELTLDQALQKAVEAHKAGQIQEAERLYTAILHVQPKHSDAKFPKNRYPINKAVNQRLENAH